MAQSNIGNILAAWSDETIRPDPSNILGLLQALRTLKASPDQSDLLAEIKGGCRSLTRSFQQAVIDTEAEMRRLPSYSHLLDFYDTTLASYSLAQKVLDRIASTKTALSPEGVDDTIEDLEHALEEMELDQEQWRNWLHSPAPRCARCGYADKKQATCPDCRVDLLIPDNRKSESTPRINAVLGSEYGQASKAYEWLQAGTASLAKFLESLRPIQNSVRQWELAIKQGDLDELEDDLAKSVRASINRSAKGLQQLMTCTETRKWADINDGWTTVFKAAVAFRQMLPEIHRALGDEETALVIEQSQRPQNTA